MFSRTNPDYRGRAARFGFSHGRKYRLIFLDVEDERVTILIGSREDKFDEAVRELDSVLATVEWTNLETWHLRDDLPEAWLSKIDALMAKGLYDEALEASERALSLNNDLPQGWLRKGWTLLALERNDEALEASGRALSLAHGNPEAWITRTRALSSLERNEEALEAIEEALSLEPDSPRVWLAKGEVLLALGRNEEALEASVRVMSLSPNLWEEQDAEDLRDRSLAKANGQNETSE